MMTKVDKSDSSVVFKVTSTRGKLICYRVFPIARIGDSSSRWEFKTLTEAREFIGKPAVTQASAA